MESRMELSQQQVDEKLQQEMHQAVMTPSSVTLLTPKIRGYDFNAGVSYPRLLESFLTTGCQASSLARAVQVVSQMLSWTLSDEPCAPDESEEFVTAEARQQVRCKVFLAYTSNIITAGTRDILRFLAQHRMVQVMVTTAGGIEEDFIKCMASSHLGEFSLPGDQLRRKNVNRAGNILIPNHNYCLFESWLMPILATLHDEQDRLGARWTPSKLIARLGKEINHPESVYYWCYKNGIPVFCPAITDGSLGDMLFSYSFRRPGLVVDVVEDVCAVNLEAMRARKTGVIILGGGVAKHHTLNANLMRNGADFAVFINTASEYDGSDSGALPEEAVSWGKLRLDSECTPVKVTADVTLAFPLLVAATFASRFHAGLDVGNSHGKAIFNKGYTPTEHHREECKMIPRPNDVALKRLGAVKKESKEESSGKQ